MSTTLESSALPLQTSGEPPRVIAPDAGHIFAARARRFEQLAQGHVLADWLRFLGLLSHAQQEALNAFPRIDLPGQAELARAHQHRMPPLPAQSWPRDAVWRATLTRIASIVLPQAPAVARADLQRLLALPAGAAETLAERVLHTDLYGEDVALLPYVAAALQVMWTTSAARLGPQIEPLDVPGVCPCCGFLPVASVVKGVGEVGNLRYLHCALCNTEWNLVRVKCAACDANENISYRHLDSGPFADSVRAETCEDCKSYLKIFYQEKGAQDPVADDLASLALDILVDEAGYTRAGPNLLLVTAST